MHGAQHTCVDSQDTPCILLHRVGPLGELKEVARGKIINPLIRDLHHSQMSEGVMKVEVCEVLPEFRDIDPQMQPWGAEEHMKLGVCPKWMLEWPKTQIRLGDVLHGYRRTGGATSKPRPKVVRPPPRSQKQRVDEPAPQAAVATTTGRKLPPVAPTTGRKLPPLVTATNRHKLLLGTSSSQQSKVSSEVPDFPDFSNSPQPTNEHAIAYV